VTVIENDDLYYVYFCIFLQYNIETTEQLYEISLAQIHTTSIIICATNCNLNIFCQTFVYDSTTFSCQLYQSDLSIGSLSLSNESLFIMQKFNKSMSTRL